MVDSCLAVVANKLHASNHLADREETKHLSGHDTASSQLSRVHVADAAENGLWASVRALLGSLGEEGGWVAEALDDALEV